MRRNSALVIVIFVSTLRAQSINADIAGRIADTSTALIAGARVAIISGDTNVRYQTDTDNVGEYHLANVAPGTYRVEIEKAGFKKLVQPNLVLHSQDALAIDFQMILVGCP